MCFIAMVTRPRWSHCQSVSAATIISNISACVNQDPLNHCLSTAAGWSPRTIITRFLLLHQQVANHIYSTPRKPPLDTLSIMTSQSVIDMIGFKCVLQNK